ncbi:hypothetical protein ANO11243_008520 [Dothideomycetidae sp. 11243]|nr:hypothetical protein ANO11243_008520 [fungal sp. No.11243]
MTSRLRRTFHYPSDDEDDTSPSRNADDELDDTQQAALIADLRAADRRAALQYRYIFTALPLLAACVVLLAAPGWRLAILGASSLLASAWTVWGVPVDGDGPLEEWLPRLNGLLAGLLGVAGLVAWSKGNAMIATWAGVPLVVYVVVMVAGRELRPLDFEGLERLKYEYRGA